MKCAINLDKFYVTHVGTDVDTLHGLAYLECGNVRNVRFEAGNAVANGMSWPHSTRI